MAYVLHAAPSERSQGSSISVEIAVVAQPRPQRKGPPGAAVPSDMAKRRLQGTQRDRSGNDSYYHHKHINVEGEAVWCVTSPLSRTELTAPPGSSLRAALCEGADQEQRYCE